MIIGLSIVFLTSLVAMIFIVARHVPEVVSYDQAALLKKESLQLGKTKHHLPITAVVDVTERFIKVKVLPAIFHALELGFLVIERVSTGISNRARSIRIAIKRSSYFSSYESSYWNGINHWKKENGLREQGLRPEGKEEASETSPTTHQHDISNHNFS